jgi:hypothetical protein
MSVETIENTETTETERAPSMRERVKPYVLSLASLVVAGVALVGYPAVDQMGSHRGRLGLAAVSIGLLAFAYRARANATLRPVALALLTMASTWGVFNYYQFDKVVFTTTGDTADATFYYLNGKFFDELGYFRLYEAMLVADDEGERRFAKIARYRDLVAYKDILPRSTAISRADDVKGHFSDAQWDAFKHDVAHLARVSKQNWSYFFIDHGYNPPPPWTFVGGSLAKLCPVEHLKWITSVDIALIAILMMLIAWSFGIEAMFAALLFFVVTFSGRWPIVGQSLLRFDWLFGLVSSMCFLKKGHHGKAGFALLYAALNRVFPAAFGVAAAIFFVREIVQKKALSNEMRRFVLGAAVCVVVIGGGALVTQGADAYIESAQNLALHGGPESYSSHRVGFGDALLFNGEFERGPNIELKIEQLHVLMPYFKMLAALVLAFFAVVVWRSREGLHRWLWIGVYPVFIATNPQVNYFHFRMLLVLLHAEVLTRDVEKTTPLERAWHSIALAFLFIIEVATQSAMVMGASRYVVTVTTSVGLLIYLTAALAYTAWQLKLSFSSTSAAAPRR